jgi:hypothetical protein
MKKRTSKKPTAERSNKEMDGKIAELASLLWAAYQAEKLTADQISCMEEIFGAPLPNNFTECQITGIAEIEVRGSVPRPVSVGVRRR